MLNTIMYTMLYTILYTILYTMLYTIIYKTVYCIVPGHPGSCPVCGVAHVSCTGSGAARSAGWWADDQSDRQPGPSSPAADHPPHPLGLNKNWSQRIPWSAQDSKYLFIFQEQTKISWHKILNIIRVTIKHGACYLFSCSARAPLRFKRIICLWNLLKGTNLSKKRRGTKKHIK